MAGEVEGAARETGEHPLVEHGARAGYALSGVLHLIIGYLALKVAWSAQGEDLDKTGALSAVAARPGGFAVIVAMVVGFALLSLFYLADGISGHTNHGGRKQRVLSFGKAVLYAFISYTAFTFTQGQGKEGDSSTAKTTSTLLDVPGGRVLVALVGLGFLAAAAYHVWKGLTRGFCTDLADDPGTLAATAGTYGYAAKGAALGIVGVLFGLAALRHQPEKATGLDGALHTLAGQPYGQALLTAVAVGFVAFGAYSFVRARFMRT